MKMMGFAEPVIGRAFARPVGSAHPARAIEDTTMKTYSIAAIPGGGIGTEVISAGVEVLEAVTPSRRKPGRA